MKSKQFLVGVTAALFLLIGSHAFASSPLTVRGDGTSFFPDAPQFKTIVVKFKDRTVELREGNKTVVTEGTSALYIDAASNRQILKMKGKGRKNHEPWDNALYANELSYWWNNGSREVRVNGEMWTPVKVWQTSLMFPKSEITVLGEESILGRICKVISDGESKYWIYKGIVIKEEHHESKYCEAVYEPVEIEEDVELPKGIFDLPKNHKTKDMHDQ